MKFRFFLHMLLDDDLSSFLSFTKAPVTRCMWLSCLFFDIFHSIFCTCSWPPLQSQQLKQVFSLSDSCLSSSVSSEEEILRPSQYQGCFPGHCHVALVVYFTDVAPSVIIFLPCSSFVHTTPKTYAPCILFCHALGSVPGRVVFDAEWCLAGHRLCCLRMS